MTKISKVFTTLARKKPYSSSDETKLAKVLTTFDLTALGVGSTLGVGIYVLAGEVSKTVAGPAVVLSFAIAAIASVMAGLCYAEFGSRVPKAGSAYIYSYVTIGEFIAFLIGWNLILEYSIGAASVSKALSTYIDALANYKIRGFFLEHVAMDLDGLSEYVDLLTMLICILFAVALAFGAKESTLINNIFTMCNLAVVLYVIITGAFLADVNNWKIPIEQVPEGAGVGGFAPFGIQGIIKGAAICFYGFIGFDVIATAGEETKNPKRSIPFSVIGSLSIIFIAYFTLSTILTMTLPYFDQDENAPLVYVFRFYGWVVAEYIVSFGAIFGLCASLMGSMFPLPRVIYAMSIDGLIFKFLGEINPKFKTPMYGTLLAGVLTGILGGVFNLSQLVNMMSIGTLLAYSMVAACVLLLRYQINNNSIENDNENNEISSTVIDKHKNDGLFRRIFTHLFNLHKIRSPTSKSAGIVKICVTLYGIWCLFFGFVVNQLETEIFNGIWWAILLVVISLLLVIATLVIINSQPLATLEIGFAVPWNPWLPGVSILINIYLMLQLDIMTWVRFIVWIAVGLLIYFTYGVWHSKERPIIKKRQLNNVTNGIDNNVDDMNGDGRANTTLDDANFGIGDDDTGTGNELNDNDKKNHQDKK